jgi:hypothetical protein
MFNSVDSFTAPIEDPDAPMVYGRKKEFSKRASVHAQQRANINASVRTLEFQPAKELPPLQSRFYAGVIAPESPGQRIRIEFETRSEVNEGQLVLQITNRGDTGIVYSMPQFADAVGREQWTQAVKTGAWPRASVEAGPEVYALAAKAVNTLSVSGVTEPTQSFVTVNIYSANRKTVVGQARISVYLPVQASGRGAR